MNDPDFRSFFGTERSKLVGYVRSLLADSGDMDAEDVVHDVLITLMERDAAAPLENLAAYVYRSLRNRVIDTIRAGRPTLSLEDDHGGTALIDLLKDTAPSAQESMQTRQGRERLFRALRILSEIERAVLIAHEFEGVPFRELARRLDTPVNTLLSHKFRAIRKLRNHFANVPGGVS